MYNSLYGPLTWDGCVKSGTFLANNHGQNQQRGSAHVFRDGYRKRVTNTETTTTMLEGRKRRCGLITCAGVHKQVHQRLNCPRHCCTVGRSMLLTSAGA